MDSGMVESRQTGGRNTLEADQSRYRLCRSQTSQSIDLIRGSSKTGSFEQVGGELVTPVRGADRREVVFPGRVSSASCHD
jgi:hypothetical protein